MKKKIQKNNRDQDKKNQLEMRRKIIYIENQMQTNWKDQQNKSISVFVETGQPTNRQFDLYLLSLKWSSLKNKG